MSEWLYIVDLETTGLDHYPTDKILEVGAIKINIFTQKIIPMLTEVIRHNTLDPVIKNCWIVEKGAIALKEIENGELLETVLDKLKKFIGISPYTTYNTDFDYLHFLKYFGFKEPLFCLMQEATEMCRIPSPYFDGEYKWVSLSEAHKKLVGFEKEPQTHRALSDCLVAADVFKAIQKIKANKNIIKKSIEEKNGKQIRITYQKPSGELSERIILPKEINDNQVKAYCYLRNQERNFRIDRIRKIEFIEIATKLG